MNCLQSSCWAGERRAFIKKARCVHAGQCNTRKPEGDVNLLAAVNTPEESHKSKSGVWASAYSSVPMVPAWA